MPLNNCSHSTSGFCDGCTENYMFMNYDCIAKVGCTDYNVGIGNGVT